MRIPDQARIRSLLGSSTWTVQVMEEVSSTNTLLRSWDGRVPPPEPFSLPTGRPEAVAVWAGASSPPAAWVCTCPP